MANRAPRVIGLIFSADSVRAFLAGRKTMTRRVVDPAKPLRWAVGDRVYVKEAWMQLYDAGDGSLTCLVPSGKAQQEALRRVKYRATDTPLPNFAGAWRSPLYMPKWAARLWFEVAAVRVERLQEITEEDAQAEGCTGRTYRDGRGYEPSTIDFRQRWTAINGRRAPWDSNPLVVVLGLRRLAEDERRSAR